MQLSLTQRLLATAVAGLVSLVAFTPILRELEMSTYDARAKLLARRIEPRPDLVLVTIDEHSMDQLEDEAGKWPWPPSLLAHIGDVCAEADVLVYDILMSEPSGPGRESDDRYFEDFADLHNVVLPVAVPDNGSPELRFPLPRGHVVPGRLEDRVHTDFVRPYPSLIARDIRLGHVRADEDGDGVLRSYQVLLQAGPQELLPSLAMQAVLAATPSGAESLEVGPQRLAWEGGGIAHDRGRVRYYQTRRAHRSYRAADVLASWRVLNLGGAGPPPVAPEEFRGKIVLVGGIAEGLQDRAVTPAGDTQGMLVHAAAIDTLLTGRPIRMAPGWLAPALMLLLLGLTAMPVFERPLGMALWFVLVSVAFAAVSVGVAVATRWMVPTVAPLAALFAGSSVFGTLYWQRERRLRKEQERLERAKQAFTDMLVHDLKNSLTPTIMFLDFVRKQGRPDDPLQEMALDVDMSTRGTLRLVENLLDIRRIQEGRLPVRRSPLHLHGFLDEVRRQFGPQAQHADRSLVYVPDESCRSVEVEADAVILARVMENLLYNALKYSPPQDRIRIGLDRAARGVRVSVSNACKVIPAATLDTLFDAFVRASPETQQEVRSSGLGLAFCRLALEAHDGDIAALSPRPGLDDGIEVAFTIPVSTRLEKPEQM